ncbi:uncharacterized protein [Venturia canescens]|uniref:uncharacterized protein isoform X2 n=1 Tax=Venturia canescens TaxID=32260 RepID=UPI001C9C380E|nr:uncharacterized protein LOC122416178 isoform X2 [Venturia canescens]
MEEVNENILEATAKSYDDVRKMYTCQLCKSLTSNYWNKKHLSGKQHIARVDAFKKAFLITEKQPFCKICNIKVVWEKVEDHANFHNIAPFWEPEDKHQRFFTNFLMSYAESYYCHLCEEVLNNLSNAESHLKDEGHLELRKKFGEYDSDNQWRVQFPMWLAQGITPGPKTTITCRMCDITMDPSKAEKHIILPSHVRNKQLHCENVLKRANERKLDKSSQPTQTSKWEGRISPTIHPRQTSESKSSRGVTNESINFEFLEQDLTWIIRVSDPVYKLVVPNNLRNNVKRNVLYCIICLEHFSDAEMAKKHISGEHHRYSINKYGCDRIVMENISVYRCSCCARSKVTLNGIYDHLKSEGHAKNLRECCNQNRGQSVPNLGENTSDKAKTNVLKTLSSNASSSSEILSSSRKPEGSTANSDNSKAKDSSSSKLAPVHPELTSESKISREVKEESNRAEFLKKGLNWVIQTSNPVYKRAVPVDRRFTWAEFYCVICLKHCSTVRNVREHTSGKFHKNSLKQYGCDRIVMDNHSAYYCLYCNRSKKNLDEIYDHLTSDEHAKHLIKCSGQINGQSVSFSMENISDDISAGVSQPSHKDVKPLLHKASSFCHKPEPSTANSNNTKAKYLSSSKLSSTHPGLMSKDFNWVIRVSDPVYELVVPTKLRMLFKEKVLCCIICLEHFSNVEIAKGHISGVQHKSSTNKYGCDLIVMDNKSPYHCFCCNQSKNRLNEIYDHLISGEHAEKLKECRRKLKDQSASLSTNNKSDYSRINRTSVSHPKPERSAAKSDENSKTKSSSKLVPIHPGLTSKSKIFKEVKKESGEVKSDDNSKAKGPSSSKLSTIHPKLTSESKIYREVKEEIEKLKFRGEDLNWVIRVSNPVYKRVVPVRNRQESEGKVFCCLMCFEYFADVKAVAKHISEAHHINYMQQYGCEWIETTQTGDYYCVCCSQTKKDFDQIYNHLISDKHLKKHRNCSESKDNKTAVISADEESSVFSEQPAPCEKTESSDPSCDNSASKDLSFTNFSTIDSQRNSESTFVQAENKSEEISTMDDAVLQTSRKDDDEQLYLRPLPTCDESAPVANESASCDNFKLILTVNFGSSSQCVFPQEAKKSSEIGTTDNAVSQPLGRGLQPPSTTSLSSREDSCSSELSDEISRSVSNISPTPSQNLVPKKTENTSNIQSVKAHISGIEHRKSKMIYGCYYIEVTPQSKYRCQCCNIMERTFKSIYKHVMSDDHVKRAWDTNRTKDMQSDVERAKSDRSKEKTNDCSSQNVAAIESSSNFKTEDFDFCEKDLHWVVSRMHALCITIFRVRGKKIVRDTGERLFYCLICRSPEYGDAFDIDAVKTHIFSEMHEESMEKYGCAYIYHTEKSLYCCECCKITHRNFDNIYRHVMSKEHVKQFRKLDEEDSRIESESDSLLASNVSKISPTDKSPVEKLGFREFDLRWVVDVSDTSASTRASEGLDASSSSKTENQVFHCFICSTSFSDVEIAENHVSSEEHASSMKKYGCDHIVVTPSLYYRCECCDCRKKSFRRMCVHIMGNNHAEKLRELDQQKEEQPPIVDNAEEELSEISNKDSVAEQPIDDDSKSSSIYCSAMEEISMNELSSYSSFNDAESSVISKISETTTENVEKNESSEIKDPENDILQPICQDPKSLSTVLRSSSPENACNGSSINEGIFDSLPEIDSQPASNSADNERVEKLEFRDEDLNWVVGHLHPLYRPAKKPPNNFYCVICSAYFSRPQKALMHISGPKHIISMEKYGCHYIEATGESKFRCTCCNTECKSFEEIRSHVKSEDHMKKADKTNRINGRQPDVELAENNPDKKEQKSGKKSRVVRNNIGKFPFRENDLNWVLSLAHPLCIKIFRAFDKKVPIDTRDQLFYCLLCGDWPLCGDTFDIDGAEKHLSDEMHVKSIKKYGTSYIELTPEFMYHCTSCNRRKNAFDKIFSHVQSDGHLKQCRKFKRLNRQRIVKQAVSKDAHSLPMKDFVETHLQPETDGSQKSLKNQTVKTIDEKSSSSTESQAFYCRMCSDELLDVEITKNQIESRKDGNSIAPELGYLCTCCNRIKDSFKKTFKKIGESSKGGKKQSSVSTENKSNETETNDDIVEHSLDGDSKSASIYSPPTVAALNGGSESNQLASSSRAARKKANESWDSSSSVPPIEPFSEYETNKWTFYEPQFNWMVSLANPLFAASFHLHGKSLLRVTAEPLFCCLICFWPGYGDSFDTEAAEAHIISEEHALSIEKYGCRYVEVSPGFVFDCECCNVQKKHSFCRIFNHVIGSEHALQVGLLKRPNYEQSSVLSKASSGPGAITMTPRTSEYLDLLERDSNWVVDRSNTLFVNRKVKTSHEKNRDDTGEPLFHCLVCCKDLATAEIAKKHISRASHLNTVEQRGWDWVKVTRVTQYRCICCDFRTDDLQFLHSHVTSKQHGTVLGGFVEKIKGKLAFVCTESEPNSVEKSAMVSAPTTNREVEMADENFEFPYEDWNLLVGSEAPNDRLREKDCKDAGQSSTEFVANGNSNNENNENAVEQPPDKNVTRSGAGSTSPLEASCIFVVKQNGKNSFCHICEQTRFPTKNLKSHVESLRHKFFLKRYGCDNIEARRDGSYYCACCDCKFSTRQKVWEHLKDLKHLRSVTKVKRESRKLLMSEFSGQEMEPPGERFDNGFHESVESLHRINALPKHSDNIEDHVEKCDSTPSRLDDSKQPLVTMADDLTRLSKKVGSAGESALLGTNSSDQMDRRANKSRRIVDQGPTCRICRRKLESRTDLHAHMAKHFSKELLAINQKRLRENLTESNGHSTEFDTNQSSDPQSSLNEFTDAAESEESLIKIGDSSSSESDSESGDDESEDAVGMPGWDVDRYLKTTIKGRKRGRKMKLKNILQRLNFKDNDIYNLEDKIMDLLLGLRMSIIIDNETIYCLICRARVPNTSKDYYDHLWSLNHCNYLDVMEDDAKEFANFPDQFSDLDLAYEYMEEISDRAVRCYLCQVTVKNEDESLKNHIYEVEHERACALTRANASSIFESMKSSLKCDWYGIEHYSCLACRIVTQSEVSFVKHLKSTGHSGKMLESPNFERKMLLDCCLSCAILWYGYRSSHFHHTNDVDAHRWFVNDGHYCVRDIPKLAQELLRQPENWVDRKIRYLDGMKAGEISKEEAVVNDLQRIVRATFPHAKAYIFGSRVTGLNSENSDIDIFLDCRDVYDGTGTSDSITLYFINNVGKCLSSASETWDVHEVLTHCRSPIIRAHHRPTRLDCDISFNNGLAVEKTKLIKRIVDVYPTYRKLVLILKMWMASCDLAGPERITHNSLYWLVVFHLQNETILPSIATLISMENKSKIIAGCEVGISYDFNLWGSDENSSVKDLLERFFTFYANFDFRYDVVCPLLGEPIKKKDFADPENLPKQMKMYVKVLKKSKKAEMFRIDSPMCIQDPFDLSQNVTKAVRKNVLNRFRTCCLKSLDFLI